MGVHCRLEGGAFDGPYPHLAPARDGHIFDERALGFGLWVELAGETGEEIGEGFGPFVLKEDRLRE